MTPNINGRKEQKNFQIKLRPCTDPKKKKFLEPAKGKISFSEKFLKNY
jgi:hypothetical protein